MEKRRKSTKELSSKSRTSNKRIDVNKDKKINKSKNSKNNKDNIKFSKNVMVNDRKKKKRISKVIISFVVTGLLISGGYLLFTLQEFNLKNINLNETEK